MAVPREVKGIVINDFLFIIQVYSINSFMKTNEWLMILLNLFASRPMVGNTVDSKSIGRHIVVENGVGEGDVGKNLDRVCL